MAGREDMDFTSLERSASLAPYDGQTTLACENFDQVAFAIRWKMAGDNKGSLQIARNLCKKGTEGFDSSSGASHHSNGKFFRIGGVFNRG
jgi:hypothetical protein